MSKSKTNPATAKKAPPKPYPSRVEPRTNGQTIRPQNRPGNRSYGPPAEFDLGARNRYRTLASKRGAGRRTFNIVQVGLAVVTLAALGGLFEAVRNGLLGQPEMQVMGNGSHAYALRWYQDRARDLLPQAAVLSVSIWFYKLLMLAWALWLAFALLGWARWGWESTAAGGLWRPIKSPPKVAAEASTE